MNFFRTLGLLITLLWVPLVAARSASEPPLRLPLGTAASVRGNVLVRLQNGSAKLVIVGYTFRAGDQIKVQNGGLLTMKYRDGQLHSFTGPTSGWQKLLRHQTSEEKALSLELASQLQPAVKPKGEGFIYPAEGAVVPSYGFFVQLAKRVSGRGSLLLEANGKVVLSGQLDLHHGVGSNVQLTRAVADVSEADLSLKIECKGMSFESGFARVSGEDETALEKELGAATKSVKFTEDAPLARAVVLAKHGFSALARRELLPITR